MSVLCYAACDQDRQRYYAAGIQCHENHVRAGFRNDSYQGGKEYHQGDVLPHPRSYVEVLCADVYERERSERPEENGERMAFYDVRFNVYELAASEYRCEHERDGQYAEKDVHPRFIEQVYAYGCAAFVGVAFGAQ